MEKLHRFSKQKVLLNVKNGVCICMSLSFLGGWNIQDVVPKVESRGPWVKVLYNFYKPEQNQARWYLCLHIGKSCLIRTRPAHFSLFCLLLHVWLVITLHTNRTIPVTMTECLCATYLIADLWLLPVLVVHCCWRHTTDALASSRALSRSTELSSRQVIGWCLHHPWHAPPPPLDTSVVFIRAEEPCAILC